MKRALSLAKRALPLALLGGACLAPMTGAAQAQEISANVALTTDYRFRGASLSDETLAIQGGFDVAFESGFYVGTWGSSIEPVGNSELELDLYAGYGGTVGALSYDVGVLGYFYPGADDVAYGEVYGSLTGMIGILETTGTIAYAPEQDNLGDDDNLYLNLSGSAPLGESGLSLSLGIGYETGAFGDLDGDGDDKIDWTIGIGGAAYGVDWSLAYIDTSEDTDGSDATAVFTIAKSF
ncbi:TorF family putative porin [Oceanicaulis sp. LC35]|uniref:TorF family putative porin n=1 Tax=Oceanicaulis sp. LC35 TaxID=3349635 RepID=UPI003F84FB77